MSSISEEKLNNYPDDYALWRGLGGNFDNLTQILNEFIDNSLSNFLKNDDNEFKKIFIRIQEFEHQKFQIEIEDTGSGIKNLSSAFSIGTQSDTESPLNEHGFGMKHALAAANKENDTWEILTRTEDGVNNNYYYKVTAPFLLKDLPAQKVLSQGYDGVMPTGTIIRFNVSFEWLKTIVRGIKGNFTQLKTITDVLVEDIGYTYGSLLNESGANITVFYKDLEMEDSQRVSVQPVEPVVKDVIDPGIGTTEIDLGNGKVKLDFKFLVVTKSDYKKHYLANMNTSGVEIRLNGRLLADNLFSEIWDVEKHNSFNYLLIQINLSSKDPHRLPKTSTNKTSLLQDDVLLSELYSWIREKLSAPKKEASLADHEVELFQLLKEKQKKLYTDFDPSLVISTEKYAFTSLKEKIRIDLYRSFQNETTIYEGKKDSTTPKDVYQLLMYWDGLIFDKVKVANAVLVAANHPDSVKTIVAIKNKSMDASGNQYQIRLQTWNELDINYPN